MIPATVPQVYEVYKLYLPEDEVGNRAALFKAQKYMGDDSDHVYPSAEQMPFMAVKDAAGGGSAAKLESAVDDKGRWVVEPTEGEAPATKSSFHVAQQAKLKMNTMFLELVDKPVPHGYDGAGAGLQPTGTRANRDERNAGVQLRPRPRGEGGAA